MSIFMSDFCLYLCLYGHKKKPVMVVDGVLQALTAKIGLILYGSAGCESNNELLRYNRQ